MKQLLLKSRQLYRALIEFVRKNAWDLVVVAGGLMLFAGLWSIYSPVALVVAGGMLLHLGILGVKR